MRVGVGGGWLEQVGLKLTQSPAKAGVEVGTELGNIFLLLFPAKVEEEFFKILERPSFKKEKKQAGAELCQAQNC